MATKWLIHSLDDKQSHLMLYPTTKSLYILYKTLIIWQNLSKLFIHVDAHGYAFWGKEDGKDSKSCAKMIQ